MKLVVIGVSGCGKSTVAEELGRRLEIPVLEGDDFHPGSSLRKMQSGQPLGDADRWPWLARLRQELASVESVVMTCSALRVAYRDLLRSVPGVRFAFVDITSDDAALRVDGRSDHFMPSTLVASQFETLQRPEEWETDILTVDGTAPVSRVVDVILARLATLSTPTRPTGVGTGVDGRTRSNETSRSPDDG